MIVTGLSFLTRWGLGPVHPAGYQLEASSASPERTAYSMLIGPPTPILMMQERTWDTATKMETRLYNQWNSVIRRGSVNPVKGGIWASKEVLILEDPLRSWRRATGVLPHLWWLFIKVTLQPFQHWSIYLLIKEKAWCVELLAAIFSSHTTVILSFFCLLFPHSFLPFLLSSLLPFSSSLLSLSPSFPSLLLPWPFPFPTLYFLYCLLLWHVLTPFSLGHRHQFLLNNLFE